VAGESGGTKAVFDFRALPGPPALLAACAAGFARMAGPDHPWRAAATCDNGYKAIRESLRWAAALDPPQQAPDDIPRRCRRSGGCPAPALSTDGPASWPSASGCRRCRASPPPPSRHPPGASRPAPDNPVAPARRSAAAQAKASGQHDPAGQLYHSFRGLLEHLATLTRNQVRYTGTQVTIAMLAEPTSTQRQAFGLIGAPIPLTMKISSQNITRPDPAKHQVRP
jgi:hypothetical protein